MTFYDLSKDKRQELVGKITKEIKSDLEKATSSTIHLYFSDEDTYIRKTAYLAIGKLYNANVALRATILTILNELFNDPNELVRQTVVNALGEIGKTEADKALSTFEKAMLDTHHKVRNAVIGSLKKMGEKNPKPVLTFSKKFLHDSDPEVRRQAVHGIELWGRTHPEDVLPLLEELQDESNRRVRNMVIHVIGQVSYKKGCLEIVVSALKAWKNKELVSQAKAEILETHKAYENFSNRSYEEAKRYLEANL